MNGKPSQPLVATLAVNAVNGCSNQAIGSPPNNRQQLVDHAELLVEHALPDERGDVVRHRPRQDQQHAVDRPQRQARRVEREREREPDA